MIAICAQRWDVASYALGLLDDAAATRFEEHLADCASCADELADLLPTVGSLAEVDRDTFDWDANGPDGFVRDAFAMDESSWPQPSGAGLSGAAPAGPTEPMGTVSHLPLSHVRGRSRSRHRPQRRLLVGIAALLLLLGAGLVLLVNVRGEVSRQAALTGHGTAVATGTAAPTLTGPGERRQAIDPRSGVRLDVLAADKPWGTQLSFAITDVTGPRRCRLVTVAADGTAEVVSSWQVPVGGYGTPSHPSPLTLQASSSSALADLAKVEVQALDKAGQPTLLIALPLH